MAEADFETGDLVFPILDQKVRVAEQGCLGFAHISRVALVSPHRSHAFQQTFSCQTCGSMRYAYALGRAFSIF